MASKDVLQKIMIFSVFLFFIPNDLQSQENVEVANSKLYRSIIKEITVPAGVDDVWKAWTTKEGIISFFAPDGIVELKINGLYEIYFSPEGEPGRRGAEDNRILAVEPNKMFSFSWDAPGNWPNVRKQRTMVVLKFKILENGSTALSFCQTGWGDGEEWDQVYDYFLGAWDDVFDRLIERFENGPVDWETRLKKGV